MCPLLFALFGEDICLFSYTSCVNDNKLNWMILRNTIIMQLRFEIILLIGNVGITLYYSSNTSLFYR